MALMVAMKFTRKSECKCSAFIYSMASVKTPLVCRAEPDTKQASALREQIFKQKVENKLQRNPK